MFLTLTAVDISVVFTAKSLAVEELGVGALLHVLGEGAVVAGILLVGTVVVQLALSGVREHGRLVLLASLLRVLDADRSRHQCSFHSEESGC